MSAGGGLRAPRRARVARCLRRARPASLRPSPAQLGARRALVVSHRGRSGLLQLRYARLQEDQCFGQALLARLRAHPQRDQDAKQGAKESARCDHAKAGADHHPEEAQREGAKRGSVGLRISQSRCARLHAGSSFGVELRGVECGTRPAALSEITLQALQAASHSPRNTKSSSVSQSWNMTAARASEPSTCSRCSRMNILCTQLWPGLTRSREPASTCGRRRARRAQGVSRLHRSSSSWGPGRIESAEIGIPPSRRSHEY